MSSRAFAQTGCEFEWPDFTGVCLNDNDGDGLNNGEEEVVYGTDPDDADCDDDGLNDYAEVITYDTDPWDSDTDDDGLDDYTEVSAGLDPLYWDSDEDGLPDYFEYTTSGYDALDDSDAVDDNDSDGNSNVDEYYNLSDPESADPNSHQTTFSGCYYWSDGDGNGVVTSTDRMKLVLELLGTQGDYSMVIPPTKMVFDLDANGSLTSVDRTILQIWLLQSSTTVLSTPQSLDVASTTCTGNVLVGDTCEIVVEPVNSASTYTQTRGFATVFSVDTGSATLFGGDGDGPNSGERYDFTGPYGSDYAVSRIVVRPDSSGTIDIDAAIPSCGNANGGRYCAGVSLSSPVEFTAVNP